MLLLLPAVCALYLREKGLDRYVAVQSRTVTLSPVERATDFVLAKGTAPSLSVVLQDPVSKNALDQSGGSDSLIAWPMHRSYNQSFRVVLTADNAYLLVSSRKCLRYIESSASFLRINCSAGPSAFDVLYEVSYVKQLLTDHLFLPRHRGHHRHHHHDDVETVGRYPFIQSQFYFTEEDHHSLGPYADPYLGTPHSPRLAPPYNERYIASYGRSY